LYSCESGYFLALFFSVISSPLPSILCPILYRHFFFLSIIFCFCFMKQCTLVCCPLFECTLICIIIGSKSKQALGSIFILYYYGDTMYTRCVYIVYVFYFIVYCCILLYVCA
jgi:hypothetical protein